MKVAVLGSGIVGVASAWWLRQAGHDVVVVDRQNGPAQETSFANGAQISVSYSEPWANAQAPLKLLKWLFRDDAPLLFRPQLDWRQWQWGLSFLGECFPSRLAPNIRAMVGMAAYSRSTLQQMRRELGIEYDHTERGILSFFRDQADLDGSRKSTELLRELGVERRIISTEEAIAIEPALAPSRALIVGGDYTKEDETGDVYKFTAALAKLCAEAGVEFRFNTQITRLVSESGKVSHVEVIDDHGAYGKIKADVYVAAMGSFTPLLVRPLGVPCNVYPTKGYSATFPILNPDAVIQGSISDLGNKVVFTRMGDRLRMAGTAELSGYSRDLNTPRCQALFKLAYELFPTALDFDKVEYWSGLRPSTPSNVPIIGRTRLPNLYLNTGHGTLGWTMGPGSGRYLADLISGRKPEADFPHLAG